jgi:3-hydroxymyristoyl/3-hydroxydecanoyl-(acyl carrier protein) dehydratase
VSAAVDGLLRDACRGRLAGAGPGAEVLLDRAAVERLVPHRDPFLLVDRVRLLDAERGLIAGSYDLARAEWVFAAHFPGRPVWPGVLQVEAIGQAGCVLYAAGRGRPMAEVAGTSILGARFVRPVIPGGEVEIVARGFEDGLFYTVVGQCLQDGRVCSAAALQALTPAPGEEGT